MPGPVQSNRSLWRSRDFNLLWGSQTVSTLGDQVASIAFPLLVLALTGSATRAGAVGSVQMIAGYAGALVGGVLVDRHDRRVVVVVSDSVRGVALAALATLIMVHHASWEVIMAIAAITGACKTPVSSALQAAVVRVVDERQVERAVAADQARSQAASVVGPPLGGFLYALGSSIPFFVDAVSYAASVLGACAIRASLAIDPSAQEVENSLWHGLTAGFRWLAARRPFAALCGCAALLNLTGSAATLLVVLLCHRDGATSSQIGLALALGSVGGIAGSVIAGSLIARLGSLRALLTSLWAMVVLVPIFAIAPGFVGIGATLFVLLLVFPAASVVVVSQLLRSIPDNLRGRVMSAVSLATGGLSAAGPIAAGVLDQQIGALSAVVIAIPALLGATLVTCIPMARSAVKNVDAVNLT